MPEPKRVPWGELDVLARSIESVANECIEQWNTGEIRLTPEECKRLASYLSRVRVSHSKLRDTLKLFESLVQHSKAQTIIEKIVHDKDKN